jgi:hypothetical protein
MPPLRAKLGLIGGEPDHLVTQESDELRRGGKASNDGVHGREGCLVAPPGDTGTAIAIDQELMAWPARDQRWDSRFSCPGGCFVRRHHAAPHGS